MDFNIGDTVLTLSGNPTKVTAVGFSTVWYDREDGRSVWASKNEMTRRMQPPMLPTPSQGVKYDNDKPRMDLLVSEVPVALESVAKALTLGAEKYPPNNWQRVPDGSSRYTAALLRHLTAYHKGEKVDPESGLSHLAHVATNAMFILELEGKA